MRTLILMIENVLGGERKGGSQKIPRNISLVIERAIISTKY